MSPFYDKSSPQTDGRSPSQSSGADEGGSRFAFVAEGTIAQARSHAMREHWRQRQRRKQKPEDRRTQRKILPYRSPVEDSRPKPDGMSGSVVEYPNRDVYLLHQHSSTYIKTSTASGYGNENVINVSQGVPIQALTGLNHALASSRLDPFEMFPVELTSKHHKLLHHCSFGSSTL
jgi:hypothetical protein